MNEFKGTVGNWILKPSSENGIDCEIWNDRLSEDKQICIAQVCVTSYAEENANAKLLVNSLEILWSLQRLIQAAKSHAVKGSQLNMRIVEAERIINHTLNN